jgi:ribose transport system permease protein
VTVEPDSDSTRRTIVQSAGEPAPPAASAHRSLPRASSWAKLLSFKRLGAVYVWIVIIIIFSFWAPDTFPKWVTVQSVLNQNAIPGLVALAVVVPLSAGVFDLSVGSGIGLCNIVVAWLLVNEGVSIPLAILLTVLFGIVIGLVNAAVVVGARVDSFIATLATGSLMAAATSLLSKDQSILGNQLNGAFSDLATESAAGIAIPAFLFIAVAIVLWYFLNYTVSGRRMYAVGFNERAARLSGVKTSRLRFASLLVSGVVVGIGGVLLTSQVSAGSPDIGPPYLLNAFAAAFLGATQLGGRFNAWGTVVAVLLLGTGDTGLNLVAAPTWVPSMFSGVVLLAALVLTKVEGSGGASGRLLDRLRSKRDAGDEEPTEQVTS